MRFGPIVLVLALAAGSAAAADLTDPVWTQAPGRDDWVKSYPAHAAQAGLAGNVKLKCAAGANGSLQNCSVLAESPTGEGFGAAAMALTSGMQLKPTTESGESVAGRSVVVPVKFDPGILKPGWSISPAGWLKQPSQDAVANYWPAAARDGGKATIRCVITNRGTLDACSVVFESKPGLGLGEAALAMSSMFLMRPMTVDGQPVAGTQVAIPVNFVGSMPPASEEVRVARQAPWIAAPDAGQISAAYPKAAIGKLPGGHAVLECGLANDGSLKACTVMSEEPRGDGFGAAALALSKTFRAIVDPRVDHVGGLKVQVPFDFRDPSQPAQANVVYDPMWLRRMNPAALPQYFPAAAAKAGLKSGGAVVECMVARDGTLATCHVAEETPPGYGFGEVALGVASVMKMSVWTAQGGPVEGATVRVPVELTAPDASPPPAKP